MPPVWEANKHPSSALTAEMASAAPNTQFRGTPSLLLAAHIYDTRRILVGMTEHEYICRALIRKITEKAGYAGATRGALSRQETQRAGLTVI